MKSRHAAEEKSLYPTKQAVIIILGIGLILGILIVVFLVIPAFQPIPVTVLPHITHAHKIIAKTPHVTLTAAQLHAHHLWHVACRAHRHALHVKHLAHMMYLRGLEASASKYYMTGGQCANTYTC